MADGKAIQTEGIGLPKGAKVGKYEVVQRLGSGGQAIVYKAYDPLLDRHVALKQIGAHLAADPKFLERFRREAQILAKLGSEQPAIVTIHEMIQDEQGLFIVMEYLPGHSLEEVLEDTKGPVEAKATLQIIWRLAAALHAVHSAGIIHRDLKPSNIIIGEGLRAKITDFGVAASVTGQTSMVLGTTKYMAPELFEGARVDGRADMYSLGFIAYEMLAGRPKFNEIFADVVRDRHSQALRWMKWHGNESVQAPPLHEVNPGVTRELSDIVAKMITKNPEDRIASMEALGRAIKSAFSPRGRSAQRTAAARTRAKARQPVAVGAGSVALGAGGDEAGLGPGDEGDELEIGAAAPSTAPIPKISAGRRILIHFVLPVVILLAIGGGVGGVWHLVEQSRRDAQAKETAASVYKKAIDGMQAALKSYETKSFQDARDDFVNLQKSFPPSDLTTKASVWNLICSAYVAVASRQWDVAAARRIAAEERLKEIQATNTHLEEWTRTAKEYVQNFHSYYMSTRTFREAMDKARDAFEAQQFLEARQVLSDTLRNVVLTPVQEKEQLQFMGLVDLTEFRAQVQAQIRQGDDLLGRVKLAEAEDAYLKAQDLLKGSRAVIMPAAERDKINAELGIKLRQLTSDRTLRDALAAVNKARSGGNKRELLGALLTLKSTMIKLKLTIDPAVADEIPTLQSDLELERGRKLKAAGQIAEARQAFQKAIELKANKEAEVELASLDQAQSRATLISDAGAHFAAGRWTEALAKYEAASQIEMSDDLAEKIVECRFRIALAEAHQLRADKKYDEAIAGYETARKVKAAASALIDGYLEAMAADRKFEKHMSEGFASLKRAEYARALESFREAEKIRKNEETQAAIADTRYQQNVAEGRACLEANDFNGALGYLNLAKGFKDTDEVRKLIAETEKRKQAAESGS